MRTLALALAATMATGIAFAQTSTTPNSATNTSAAPAGTSSSGTAGGQSASPDHNNAVNTSAANQPQPAKGANSFTAGQARSRIAAQGFAQVADLKKDQDGVWRGRAQKNGQQVGVWLDYKGNVGQN